MENITDLPTFKNWNRRSVPQFKEERIDSKDEPGISITAFQKKNSYDAETREKLVNYINSCNGIVATTIPWINAYTGNRVMSHILLTDGEVIFTNRIQEYIQYNDFALPERWFQLIKSRSFKVRVFTLNFDVLMNPGLNIWNTSNQTFDEEPLIRKAIILA